MRDLAPKQGSTSSLIEKKNVHSEARFTISIPLEMHRISAFFLQHPTLLTALRPTYLITGRRRKR